MRLSWNLSSRKGFTRHPGLRKLANWLSINTINYHFLSVKSIKSIYFLLSHTMTPRNTFQVINNYCLCAKTELNEWRNCLTVVSAIFLRHAKIRINTITMISKHHMLGKTDSITFTSSSCVITGSCDVALGKSMCCLPGLVPSHSRRTSSLTSPVELIGIIPRGRFFHCKENTYDSSLAIWFKESLR